MAHELERVGLGGLRDARRRGRRDDQCGARASLARVELHDSPLQLQLRLELQ